MYHCQKNKFKLKYNNGSVEYDCSYTNIKSNNQVINMSLKRIEYNYFKKVQFGGNLRKVNKDDNTVLKSMILKLPRFSSVLYTFHVAKWS